MSHAIGGEIRIDSDEVVLQKARQRIGELEGQLSAHIRALTMEGIKSKKLESSLAMERAAKPRIGVPMWECSNDGVHWVDCGCGTSVHRHTRRKGTGAAIVQYSGRQPQEWSTEGVARAGNLSALQAIQARKKPEPWVPSVDDFDLLPDAPR